MQLDLFDSPVPHDIGVQRLRQVAIACKEATEPLELPNMTISKRHFMRRAALLRGLQASRYSLNPVKVERVIAKLKAYLTASM